MRLSNGRMLILAAVVGDAGHHGVPRGWLVDR
jgi:hypothetical protein